MISISKIVPNLIPFVQAAVRSSLAIDSFQVNAKHEASSPDTLNSTAAHISYDAFFLADAPCYNLEVYNSFNMSLNRQYLPSEMPLTG
jgi:hypothetical protein